MNLKIALPLLLALFSLTSIMVLRSIAPGLVAQQLIFHLIGLGLFFGISKIPYHRIKNLSPLLYIGLNLMLILTYIIGSATRGSTRWISVGGVFNIQSSQLAITIVALFVADFIEKHSLKKFNNIAKTIGIILIPALLIVIAPDLGTTIIYLISLGSLIFFSNINIKYIIYLASIGIVTATLAWTLFLQPYQKQRILSFVSPQTDTSGAGYNARQSLIAVGSGQVFGRGLGQGVQSHLRFLPERQTDFIFASLSEELGFMGSIFVLGLYSLMIAIMVYTSQHTPYNSGKLYIISIITMTVIQAGVHMGMNMGLFPITGITLPLISYGGSSVISLFLTYGLVQTNINEIKHHKIILVGT